MIIRVKDRINNPMKGSGYRDVMMNVEIDNHVGELRHVAQAPLPRRERLLGTRSIALSRAQGGYDGILDVLGLSDPPDIALHPACKEGNADVVRTWLNRGADFNCCCELEGYENKWRYSSHARTPRRSGATVVGNRGGNRRRPEGGTALHIACEKGHVATAEVLLDMGADINTADRKVGRRCRRRCWGGGGQAPPTRRGTAIAGARRGCPSSQERRHDGAVHRVPEWLRGASASVAREWGAVDKADLHGTTPLAIAKRNGHTAIVELIEDHMYPRARRRGRGSVDALEQLLALGRRRQNRRARSRLTMAGMTAAA